jgi:hypothetical protein
MSRRIVDLTVTVGADTKSPPSTDMRVELEQHRRGPGFWQVTSVSQSLHTGSHVDSALHCFAEGGTTAEIPLERVMGEAMVIDCSHAEPEQPIEASDLERAGKDIVEDLIVIVRTDWTDRTWGRFPEFFTRSPYLTEEAAEWLVARRPRLLRGIFRAAPRLHIRGLQVSPNRARRRAAVVGTDHEPRSGRQAAFRFLRAVLQDRGHRRSTRPLLCNAVGYFGESQLLLSQRSFSTHDRLID